jgi:hypothetical protein
MISNFMSTMQRPRACCRIISLSLSQPLILFLISSFFSPLWFMIIFTSQVTVQRPQAIGSLLSHSRNISFFFWIPTLLFHLYLWLYLHFKSPCKDREPSDHFFLTLAASHSFLDLYTLFRFGLFWLYIQSPSFLKTSLTWSPKSCNSGARFTNVLE